MDGQRSRALFLFIGLVLSVHLTDGDNVRLPDQAPNQLQQLQQNQQPLQQGPQVQHQPNGFPEERRTGKNLLDFVGLGTGANTDPYLARVNQACLTGELAECFKSQALSTFTDFFSKDYYNLNNNARVVRMPEYQLRSLEQEPYEFSSESRATDSEWDHLVKFALRKAEKFLKSTAIEVQFPDDITEGGRYQPRFIDEIADEIDVIEDKKAPHFSRHKLKKFFIPLLIILKLFKLKLLLFLPLILGLASFKKLLGFLAIIIPGVIGYFKFCKPQSNFGGNYYNSGFHPEYSSAGVGSASYHTHFDQPYQQGPNFAKPYGDYYFRNGQSDVSGGVRFGDNSNAQNLAYHANTEFRNAKATTA